MHLPVEGVSGQVACPCDLGDALPPGPCRHGVGPCSLAVLPLDFSLLLVGASETSTLSMILRFL